MVRASLNPRIPSANVGGAVGSGVVLGILLATLQMCSLRLKIRCSQKANTIATTLLQSGLAVMRKLLMIAFVRIPSTLQACLITLGYGLIGDVYSCRLETSTLS